MTTTEAAPGEAPEGQPFPTLRPEPTPRRQRWWFSDGAWINQGQTGGVVGAVLTHWLADRRVPGPFDEAFSVQLYHDAQRRAGSSPSDQLGATLDSGVDVLRASGLISDCLRCTSIEAVTFALLERGPVVAGVAWQAPMFEPDTSNGPPIIRTTPGADVVGGHALLLDGIDLDLELSGTTGFVRLKNSWGREWGENGLCLIPLADLAPLLEDGGEFLFLVPTTAPEPPPEDDGSHLGAARPGAGTPGPGPAEPVRYESEAIGNDQYTMQDTVGYAAYAQAIVQAIQHEDTRPPLAIGIKAPWGAGKTSLMRMVQLRLEYPTTWATTPPGSRPRRIELKKSGEQVTNRTLLNEVSERKEPQLAFRRCKEPAGAAPGDTAAWRPTVWFNPWMYQTGEQVWAGFARDIIDQITGRMTAVDRERFWLELNRTRIDEGAVRRAVYGLIFERVLPWLFFAIVAVVVGLALLVVGAAPAIAGLFGVGGPAALAVATIWQGTRVLRSRVGGSLAGAVEPADAVRKFAATNLSGAVDRIAPDPGYAGRSGFFQLVRTDVQHVIDLVATEERPLVVFIDDLDRCAPATVMQVFEAINLFLAGEFGKAIFVVAVEPEMVAAHIEVAYSDLVVKLHALSGERGAEEALGWRFLEKFIQLPLRLPPMEPEQTELFVSSLFPAAAVPSTTPSSAQPSTDAAAVSAAQQMLSSQSLDENIKLAGSVAADSAVGEALRRAVARKLSSDAPEMRAVIGEATQFLRANPREIKRFANVFRFLVTIATERRLASLEAPTELAVIAKLAILNTRWPSLVTQLMWTVGSPPAQTIFELLEGPSGASTHAAANRAKTERKKLETELKAAGVSDSTLEHLVADELLQFMAAAPRVGIIARDWL